MSGKRPSIYDALYAISGRPPLPAAPPAPEPTYDTPGPTLEEVLGWIGEHGGRALGATLPVWSTPRVTEAAARAGRGIGEDVARIAKLPEKAARNDYGALMVDESGNVVNDPEANLLRDALLFAADWMPAGLVGSRVAGVPKGAVLGSHGGSTRRRVRPPRPKYKNMSEVPGLREMSRDAAIRQARKEPHLIPAGNRSGGAYLAGPSMIKNRKDLLSMRYNLDNAVEIGAPAFDWYPQYSASIEYVTPSWKPKHKKAMAAHHAQYSPQNSPEGEVNFVLRDIGKIMTEGDPGVSKWPTQAAGTRRFMKSGNPEDFAIQGQKVHPYFEGVDPTAPKAPGATGINDFRHFGNVGYTDVDGTLTKGKTGTAVHKWTDYETALAVDRANKKKLGGRTNWTGKEVQAAAWVKQKADALYGRSSKRYLKNAKAKLGSGASEKAIEAAARQEAFEEASKTIGDFFEKHSIRATYEPRPYVHSGHMPGSAIAPQAELDRFALDPRAGWAPDGRDVIYDAMVHRNKDGLETGLGVRSLPPKPMRGIYTPDAGPLETNLGYVTNVLGAFDNVPNKGRHLTKQYKQIMDTGEALRGMVDVQGGSAWHKSWPGAPAKEHLSVTAERIPGMGRMTPRQARYLKARAEQFGYGDVADAGGSVTMTNFNPKAPMPSLDRAQLDQLDAYLERAGYGRAQRARVDSNLIDYGDAWKRGEGSGAVTDKFFKEMDKAPAPLVEALDASADIPRVTRARIDMANEYKLLWGKPRDDVMRMWEIIGAGPGWLTRLRAAKAAGVALPAAAAAILSEAEGQKPW